MPPHRMKGSGRKGTVKFRRVGDAEWKAGLDLWRLNGQRCITYHGEDHDFYEPPQIEPCDTFEVLAYRSEARVASEFRSPLSSDLES